MNQLKHIDLSNNEQKSAKNYSKSRNQKHILESAEIQLKT